MIEISRRVMPPREQIIGVRSAGQLFEPTLEHVGINRYVIATLRLIKVSHFLTNKSGTASNSPRLFQETEGFFICKKYKNKRE